MYFESITAVCHIHKGREIKIKNRRISEWD